MRHHYRLIGLLFVCAGPAFAQTPPAAVHPGALLRITTRDIVSDSLYLRGSQVMGTLADFRSDTVFLSVNGQLSQPRWYSAPTIDRVEVSTGHYHPYAKSMVIGTLSMAVAGLVGGITYHKTNGVHQPKCGPVFIINGKSFQTCTNPANSSQSRDWNTGIAIGATIGLVSGYVIAKHSIREHWKEVSLHLLSGH